MFSTWGGDFISSFVDESHFLYWLPCLKHVVILSLVKIHENCEVQAEREVTFLEDLIVLELIFYIHCRPW